MRDKNGYIHCVFIVYLPKNSGNHVIGSHRNKQWGVAYAVTFSAGLTIWTECAPFWWALHNHSF